MRGISILCSFLAITVVRAQSDVRPRPNPEFLYPDGAAFRHAVAEFPLNSANSVVGKVKFVQSGRGPVVLSGTIRGLTPGLHGFHIHEFGNVTSGCAAAGGHFNPERKNHGDRKASERHVGDLGNILANETGVAELAFEDDVIQLTGSHGIVGRALVIHSDADDLGLGGFSDSLTTGHAGNRIACATINPKVPPGPWPEETSSASRWTARSLSVAYFSILVSFILARVA